jgi:hypothetical protein
MSNLKTKLINVTNAKKYISNILQQYKENDIVNNNDIIELLSFHPTKHITKDRIDYLKMKSRPPFNKLALYYKYKNGIVEDDVSYILCIKNLFGKYNRDDEYEADVMSAFRNESHIGTKKQYFIDNTTIVDNVHKGTCSNCKIMTSNITTDHHNVPYKQIFQQFVKEENIKLSEVEIFENEQNEIRLQDIDLALKWRLYHDMRAKYRLLCKSCNSHFGSYGF